MAGYDPNEPRNQLGRWVAGAGSALKSAARAKFTGDFSGVSSMSTKNAIVKHDAEQKARRAHRATGNPKGRPPKKDEYGREVPKKEAAARARAEAVAPKVSEVKPYRGLTGDKHTDRQILKAVGRGAGVVATGVAAAGVAYGINKVGEKLGAGTGQASANVGGGYESATGHPIYDPVMDAIASGGLPVHRGPGRPRNPNSAGRPIPAAKFTIGYTHYRKTLSK